MAIGQKKRGESSPPLRGQAVTLNRLYPRNRTSATSVTPRLLHTTGYCPESQSVGCRGLRINESIAASPGQAPLPAPITAFSRFFQLAEPGLCIPRHVCEEDLPPGLIRSIVKSVKTWRWFLAGIPVAVTWIASAVGSKVASLKGLSFILWTFLPPMVVAAGVVGFVLLLKPIRQLATRAGAMEETLEAVKKDLNALGAIGHVTALRKEIKEIVRERETTLDKLPDGSYITSTTLRQVLTRARPGTPIDRFPVQFVTDHVELDFRDLNYRVLTEDTAEFTNHERLMIDSSMLRILIHNHLKKPLVFSGEPVEFTFSVRAPLIKPESDWAGVHAGGATVLVSIKVLFPSAKWVVTRCNAYKGPSPGRMVPGGEELVVSPSPVVSTATKDGVSRTCIFWQLASPDPDQSYRVEWVAHEEH